MALKISNEIKVGIFGILALTAFVVGLNYLKGMDIFSRSFTLYAEYDNLDNLLRGAMVKLNGNQVGRVEDIVMNMKTHKIRLTIKLNEDPQVPADSKIVIYSADLMGIKAVRIDYLDAKSSKLAQNEATLEGALDGGMMGTAGKMMADVSKRVDSLFIDSLKMSAMGSLGKVKEITNSVNSLLDAQNRASVAASLENLNAITKHIKELSLKLDAVVKSVNDITYSAKGTVNSATDAMNTANELLKDNKGGIQRTVSNVGKMSDSLTYVVKDVRKTLEGVNETVTSLKKTLAAVENGEGNLGKLLKSEGLYQKVDSTIKSVDRLVIDLQGNPTKYMKGIRPQVYIFGNNKSRYMDSPDETMKFEPSKKK
jgi:phospholipid/cholesterol/gamma-HCH transport system substrate-binding protein